MGISDVLDLAEVIGLPAAFIFLISLIWGTWRHIFGATKENINAASPNAAYDRLHLRITENGIPMGYRLVLQNLLNGLAALLGDDNRSTSERALGSGWQAPPAWSFSSYMVMLGIAVLYPFVFVTGGWLGGGNGALGGVPLYGAEIPLWQRWAWIVTLAISAGFFGYSLRQGRFFLFVIAILILPVVSLIGAVAVAVAGAVAFAGAFAGAVAFAGAFAGAGAVAFAVAGAVAFAGAVAVAVIFLAQRYPRNMVLSWLAAISFPLLVLSLFALDGQNRLIEIRERDIPILLFLALLPTANALLDWVSLAVSRTLLNQIANGKHGWLLSTFYFFVDAGLALLFLGMVALSTGAALALAERLHILGGAETTLDTLSLLEGIRTAPMSADYTWIYFMLLTTLIPTIVHMVAAGMSAATVVFAQPFRRRILEAMEAGQGGKDTDAARNAAVYWATMQTAGLAIALSGILFIVWAAYTHTGQVGLYLLDLVEAVVLVILNWDGTPLFK